jgi:uracil phosphoribosyltransferase
VPHKLFRGSMYCCHIYYFVAQGHVATHNYFVVTGHIATGKSFVAIISIATQNILR